MPSIEVDEVAATENIAVAKQVVNDNTGLLVEDVVVFVFNVVGVVQQWWLPSQTFGWTWWCLR